MHIHASLHRDRVHLSIMTMSWLYSYTTKLRKSCILLGFGLLNRLSHWLWLLRLWNWFLFLFLFRFSLCLFLCLLLYLWGIGDGNPSGQEFCVETLLVKDPLFWKAKGQLTRNFIQLSKFHSKIQAPQKTFALKAEVFQRLKSNKRKNDPLSRISDWCRGA